jgi:uncharacterized damage-inducible protein DinB
MTAAADLLIDEFGRIREAVHAAVDNLTPEELDFRPDSQSNSITWLAWHLTRIQDDHIAGAMQTEQLWTSEGWADRFGLPLPPADHGYGHTADEVAVVQVKSAELLTAYHDAVYEKTIRYVRRLTDADFARVVDESWDPPVTLGVRLVSVITDDLLHAGQAQYLRGLVMRQED